MKLLLPTLLMVSLTSFATPKDYLPDYSQYIKLDKVHLDKESVKKALHQESRRTSLISIKKVKSMLKDSAPMLSQSAANKVITAVQCANKYDVSHNDILTIIDYSLPSNQKRLWVFNLENYKLLYHTHVSHGIKSGARLSVNFSNRVNSKTSSIGVFNTEKSYYGRHGLSLKLLGLDRKINDNAYGRFIVMHGSWYVGEKFIKKYGRPGRSWGCPALPLALTKPIINTIKNKSILVAYYPDTKWFTESIFLNCNQLNDAQDVIVEIDVPESDKKARGEILFADLNKNNKREENEPVVAVKAERYQKIFNTPAPLKRMLRRQINKEEFIVLNNSEIVIMKKTIEEKNSHIEETEKIYFIIPEVKKLRGYYATEMIITKKVDIGNIKSGAKTPHYTTKIKSSSVKLKSTKRFIRWLGL